jgi:hypothetical protein
MHRPRPWWARAGWFVAVQGIVLLTWVVFRSTSLAEAWQFVGNAVALRGGRELSTDLWTGLAFLVPVVLWHVWTGLVESRRVRPLGWVGKSLLAGVMIAGIMTLYGSTAEFIYFQF